MSTIRGITERNALVLQWSGIPKKFWNRNKHKPMIARLGYDDTIGYGMLALIEAADRWDATRHPSFCLNATIWIEQFVTKQARKFFGIVTVPYRNNLSLETRKDAARVRQATSPNLELLTDNNEQKGPDFYEITEDLKSEEYEILALRFVEELTLDGIAQRLGYRNRQAVWLKMQRIFQKLREDV